jgi:hypothetical protein
MGSSKSDPNLGAKSVKLFVREPLARFWIIDRSALIESLSFVPHGPTYHKAQPLSLEAVEKPLMRHNTALKINSKCSFTRM